MTEKQKKAIGILTEWLQKGMDKDQYMIILDAILEERVSTTYYPWYINTIEAESCPFTSTSDSNIAATSITSNECTTTATLKTE